MAEIYIGDIDNDSNHPMHMGETDLSSKLEEIGISSRADLAEILEALCDRIIELQEEARIRNRYDKSKRS